MNTGAAEEAASDVAMRVELVDDRVSIVLRFRGGGRGSEGG